MRRLNPEKLNVEYRNGVTISEPILGRKYTLTHSDLTAELFLTIGMSYALDKISPMRDEVLAEWKEDNGSFYLYGYVYVDGQFDSSVAAVRNNIFRRELPLALEAITYGDQQLYSAHPDLGGASIWIYFDSTIPEYNQFEFWGTPNDYMKILC